MPVLDILHMMVICLTPVAVLFIGYLFFVYGTALKWDLLKSPIFLMYLKTFWCNPPYLYKKNEREKHYVWTPIFV